jgi:hypothetical protein
MSLSNLVTPSPRHEKLVIRSITGTQHTTIELFQNTFWKHREPLKRIHSTNMTGLEVGAAVFGLVAGAIDIIHRSYEIYDAVKDKKGIPLALRKVSEKLPSVEEILKDAQAQCKAGQLNQIDKQTWDSAKHDAGQCEKLCQELRQLLLSAYPKPDASEASRVWKGTKTVFSSKGKSAEALFKEISEHLDALAKRHIINNTVLLGEIKALVQELYPQTTTRSTQDVHGDVHGDVVHTINGDKVEGDKVTGNKDIHTHYHHGGMLKDKYCSTLCIQIAKFRASTSSFSYELNVRPQHLLMHAVAIATYNNRVYHSLPGMSSIYYSRMGII